jgi:hypothetical protein
LRRAEKWAFECVFFVCDAAPFPSSNTPLLLSALCPFRFRLCHCSSPICVELGEPLAFFPLVTQYTFFVESNNGMGSRKSRRSTSIGDGGKHSLFTTKKNDYKKISVNNEMLS